ncbi:hypothetical protein NBG4_670014 [Candidatus Sulfobium mesophilum]|uniref:Cyclic nucleotide-binding domain-containing protein n=1 Tax=Candidatus Sulfobium mesophilum TaxID=2016548 RepID=A0A2U3QK14_9BACT|nr:hypothetical protein NBG4_670014 [Candidatus Sulfobium mesophilum]
MQEEIGILGPGEYFAEMAFFYKDKRTASATALTDTTLLRVGKKVFLELIRSDSSIASRIRAIITRRNEELLLRESLVDITGIQSKNFHLSIKCDPSMRETTFTRERYESVVDKVLPLLEPRLIDLLLNRCIYQIYVGFNNGEVRTSSVFDPFNEEIHQANKLVDEAYIECHFAEVSYEQKVPMLRRLYEAVAFDPVFRGLPDHFKKNIQRLFQKMASCHARKNRQNHIAAGFPQEHSKSLSAQLHHKHGKRYHPHVVQLRRHPYR